MVGTCMYKEKSEKVNVKLMNIKVHICVMNLEIF